MDWYLYNNWQRLRYTLYLDRSYLLREEAEWGRAIVITYLSSAADRDINRVWQYLARHYGTWTKDLPSIRLTGEDFLISMPKELTLQDIVIVMIGPLDKALWWTSSKENRSRGGRQPSGWRYTWRIFLWISSQGRRSWGYWRTSENPYLSMMLPRSARINTQFTQWSTVMVDGRSWGYWRTSENPHLSTMLPRSARINT
jgi:hypothetical protein